MVVGVLLPFASAIFLLDRRLRGDDLSADDECTSALALGNGVPLASWTLFKTLVSGDDSLVGAHEACLGSSGQAIAGVAIVEIYLALSVIVGVNLLIALMSKTFDLVYENKDINYMYLFARLAISSRALTLLPPPLS